MYDPDGILHIDLYRNTRAGFCIELTHFTDTFQDLPAQVLLDQHEQDITLSGQRQTKECLTLLDTFATGMIDYRTAGAAGIPGGFHNDLRLAVFDESHNQFKVHHYLLVMQTD